MRINALTVLALFLPAAAGAGRVTLHQEDAQLLDEWILGNLGRQSIVTFSADDSSLVLFVSLGGTWTGDPAQWSDLGILSEFVLSMDLQRDWDLKDMAVSFGDSWCLVPMDSLMTLWIEDPAAGELSDLVRAITAVRGME